MRVMCYGWMQKESFSVVPALLGFSATQAIVIPPISESLKRNKKVPLGLDMSMSWACCLLTKPSMALRGKEYRKREMLKKKPALCFMYSESGSSGCYGKKKNYRRESRDLNSDQLGLFAPAVRSGNEARAFIFSCMTMFFSLSSIEWNMHHPHPSFQCGLRCFFVSSITPSNHCQNVKFLPGKLSCQREVLEEKDVIT